MKNHTHIESLEARIAPATLVNPTTVTYADTDGDLVTIKSSAAAFDLSQFTFVPLGVGEYLMKLDLSGLAAFQGANIDITAELGVGGNDLTTINQIKANGVDLGKVTIDGDLLRISAGDLAVATPGLKALTVQSLGVNSSYSPIGTESPTESFITGNLGSLKVLGDVSGGTVKVQGAIGKVNIGGSLVGRATGGEINASGSIGPVVIGGDIVGGGGNFPPPIGTFDPLNFYGGRIVSTNGDIDSVKVGGGIGGASAIPGTAGIFAKGNVKSIRIGSDLSGTDNRSHTGVIEVGGNLGKAVIGGSIHGGSATIPGIVSTGGVDIGGKLGQLIVGGDIEGGSSEGPGEVKRAGFVAAGKLGKVRIEGSLLGGDADFDQLGGTSQTGSVMVDTKIGSLFVGGSLGGGASKAGIYAGALANAGTSKQNLVIGSVTIGGDVENAVIAAGFLPGNIIVSNSEVQIGKVKVGGNWAVSNLTAGVSAGVDGVYGNDDDILAGDKSIHVGVISSIAKVVIDGQVSGSIVNLNDGFGFAAERIGAFKANGIKAALKPGPNSIADTFAVPGTSDVKVTELTLTVL